MTRHPASITALPRSPADDRRRRIILYTIANGLRVVCVVLCLFVQGWWLAVFIAGAVVLPYVAVVLANAKDARVGAVERPGTIVPVAPESAPSATDEQETGEERER